MTIIQMFMCTCGEALWDDACDERIAPGSYTMCAYCGQIHRFDPLLVPAPVELSSVRNTVERAKLIAMRAMVEAKLGPELVRAEAVRRGQKPPGGKFKR
jgi:hypothetical protein